MPDAGGLKVKDDVLSWKASVSWKPVDSLTTYATVSTGFRTPDVNARAGLVRAIDENDLIIPDGAKSDSVTNYESGLKGRWPGGELVATTAAYSTEWTERRVQANRLVDSRTEERRAVKES